MSHTQVLQGSSYDSQRSSTPVNVPIRVPKLRVRNVVNENEQDTIKSLHTSNEGLQENHGQSNSDGTPPQLVSTSSSSSSIPRNSGGIASYSTTPPPEPAKSKGRGLKAFLTLKEPSTAAFEEYAKNQQKSAAITGARAAGFANKSRQKLPTHIPKVNSKWDGMPQCVHDRARDSWKRSMDSQPLSQRHSKRSMKTSSKDSSSRGTVSSGSIGSQGRSVWLSDGNPQHASLETNITTPPTSPGKPSVTVSPSKPSTAPDAPHPNGMGKVEGNAGQNDTSIENQERRRSLESPATAPQISDLPSTPGQLPNDHSPNTPDDIFPWSPHDAQSQGSSKPRPPLVQKISESITPKVLIPPPSDEEPQWPLPASPTSASGFQTPEDRTSVPPIPARSRARDCMSQLGQSSNSQTSINPSLPNTRALAISSSTKVGPNPPSPTTRDPAPRPTRNFTRPFSTTTSGLNTPPSSSPSSPTTAPPPTPPPDPASTASPAFPPTKYLGPSFSLRPPAGGGVGRPGRAVVKDSDLATIPESDTASVLNAAPTPTEGNTPRPSVDADRDRHGNGDGDGQEPASRTSTSSELSASWQKPARERLGLGGFIKHDSTGVPWPLGRAEEDEAYVLGGDGRVAVGNGDAHGERDGRGWMRGKGNLMGFMRR